MVPFLATIALPLVLLALDYWPLGRFQVGTGRSPVLRFCGTPMRRLIWEKLPFFALALSYSTSENGAIPPVWWHAVQFL